MAQIRRPVLGFPNVRIHTELLPCNICRLDPVCSFKRRQKFLAAQLTGHERRRVVVVTWCFTPSQERKKKSEKNDKQQQQQQTIKGRKPHKTDEVSGFPTPISRVMGTSGGRGQPETEQGNGLTACGLSHDQPPPYRARSRWKGSAAINMSPVKDGGHH